MRGGRAADRTFHQRQLEFRSVADPRIRAGLRQLQGRLRGRVIFLGAQNLAALQCAVVGVHALRVFCRELLPQNQRPTRRTVARVASAR